MAYNTETGAYDIELYPSDLDDIIEALRSEKDKWARLWVMMKRERESEGNGGAVD